MDFGIRGKVALVVGGSKGMGRGSAEALAAEGCIVGVVARDQAGIDEAVDQICTTGGQAIGISADMATPDGIRSAVQRLTDAVGSPDIVVSLVNDFNFGSFENSNAEKFAEVFQTFTLSQVALAHATIPAMREKRWGRFIHIGSLAGKEPRLKWDHIYHNTVRPSTVGFFRSLAQEVGKYGITVNVVGPGLIRTPSFEWFTSHNLGFTKEETAQWLAGEIGFPGSEGKMRLEIALERAGEMEEIGATVAFLASRQGGYITGEWIAVDGGEHAYTF
ncbi:SDR family oxidoreductase [Sphingobium sp. DEHP117]|uniref:SDR family NAD(P)-dependent oxidoreductase n=1 Tax=Sphingobium sp. DEHP117 TaxID=2993436 RepID=UPI0027D5A96E|nr:SDR family oxidoreductase [Sphingobium sp. DEHP117]MDQ4420377.1 SDR family oxidoreductase [Sphingobium sp. DEHP117]